MQSTFKAAQRGGADHGWLNAKHSFSFADWREPSRMGFGVLRVINQDLIAPHTGFGMHGHRDMEILTYLLEGGIWHKDSMGNGQANAANSGVLRPGEIQRMSAGTGVMHSEQNQGSVRTHLLQIWLLPRTPGGPPGYEQSAVAAADLDGRLHLLAAPKDVAPQALVHINSDAQVHAGRFDGSAQKATMELQAGRLAYVHVARGNLVVNGEALEAGDGLQIQPNPGDAARLAFSDGEQAEVLVFDLGPAGTKD
jgi:quercetin 2,3-dioxygenase